MQDAVMIANNLAPSKEAIERLEKLILTLPQIEMPVTHDFCDGLYARTMFVPQGTVLTGAVHRSENFLFIRSGEITVWTDEGMKRATAGAMIKSFEGAKRVGYTHTDTLMTTVHFNPTNENDPEQLWELFTVEDTTLIEDLDFSAIEVIQ